MSTLSSRKNKIVLADYNYKRDIENRLLLAELNTFEIDVLREILNDSLKISLKHLAETLQVSQSKLSPVLDKFIPLKLIKKEGDFILVDKEMRKYYEAQILKFDDQFEPGMDFLQSLLQKVPIQVLPHWYTLPRASDHIFQAILEKFLHTPKSYEHYLQEMHFDQEFLNGIVKDVFAAPDFMVKGSVLRKKYGLTAEQFEEALILLEYNFVCCLGYNQIGDKWIEVVTPFYEWREYLRYLRDSQPKPIADSQKVVRSHDKDFAFVEDMTTLLSALQKKNLPLKKRGAGYILTSSLLPEASEDYVQELIERILFMHFGSLNGTTLIKNFPGTEWLQKTLEDKALSLSRHPTAVEKGLHRFTRCGWIYVEDFLKGFSGILSGKEKIYLRNKGKKWRYALPEYSSEERELVRTTLCHRLFEAGLIAKGTHKGKECFCVTPFGRRVLEE